MLAEHLPLSSWKTDKRRKRPMADQTITLTLSRPDAEVLVGVLASERYNPDTEAVCDGIRKQLDEKLAG